MYQSRIKKIVGFKCEFHFLFAAICATLHKKTQQKKTAMYQTVSKMQKEKNHPNDKRQGSRYAESEMRPVYSLRGVKASKLDPNKEQITVWLEEAPYSAE